MTTLDKCRSQANRKQVLSYCRPVFNSIFLYQMTSLISLQQIFCYFTSSAADFKFVIYLCFIQRERFHSFWAAWRVVVLQQAVYNLNIHSIHCHLFVTLEILMYSKSVNIELVECLLFFSVLLSSLSFDFLSFNKFSNTSPLFTHYHGNKYGNKLENRSTLFRAKFSCRYQEEITKNRKH